MELIRQLLGSLIRFLLMSSIVFIGTFWLLNGSIPTPSDLKQSFEDFKELQSLTKNALADIKRKQNPNIKGYHQAVREDLDAVQRALDEQAGKPQSADSAQISLKSATSSDKNVEKIGIQAYLNLQERVTELERRILELEKQRK
jgi:uncharacterized membrane protein YccC